MAFYLKYRSQTVHDLDITPVRQSLTRILEAQQLPHAFLFSGPKGTGKTSAARILAKAINCQHPEIKKQKNTKSKSSHISNIEPCNNCPACTAITAGAHLDVIEMDAASHRGIDDIRDLRERINLAPSELLYRVYIIDEVHMLTNEAFNALLKTLEEPPTHVIFILCTTEPQKLPDTIISRCTQVKFRKANINEVIRSLKRVIQAEKLTIDEPALKLIAAQADGSFRDAQKILEQLSVSGQELTPESVKELLGTISSEKTFQLLNLFRQKDTQAVLSWIETAASEGADMVLLSRSLLELLHQALLVKHQVSTDDDEVKQISQWPLLDLSQLTQIITQVAKDTPTAIIPQLPLELAAVKWSHPEARKGSHDKPSDDQNVINDPTLKKPQVTPSQFSSSPPSSQPTSKPASRSTTPNQSPPSPSSPSSSTPISTSNPRPNNQTQNITFDTITNGWPQVLATVKPKNHSVEGLLRATRPKSLDGSNLVIEVFYQFHQQQLQSQAKRTIVEQAISEVFDLQLNLVCQLGQRPKASTNPSALSEPPIPEYSQKPASSLSPGNSSPGPSIKPSPLASPSEEEQDLASIAAEIFGA